MGLLSKNTKSLATNMGFLTNAFQAWLGFLGVRELARMSDEIQNLQSRLKITAREGENTAETFQKIVDLADRTKQSIGDTGAVYNRLAISLAKVNPTADELVSLSETLINTFRIAGATAQETSATLIQLSQAFSSGKLSGEELRAVMEQNGVLAKALNKEYGSDLKKKAAEGNIRLTDVLRILSKEQKNILDQSGKLTDTFENTMTRAMNKLTVAVGEFNQQLGLSTKFASAMEFAVDNLASVMVVLGGILTVIAISKIPAMIDGFKKLQAVWLLISTTNPILLTLTAIAVVAGLVYANIDRLTVVFKKFQATAYDFAASIEEALNPIRNSLSGKDSPIAKAGEQRVLDFRKQADRLRAEASKLEKDLNKKNAVPDAKKNIDSLLARAAAADQAPEKLEKIKDILGKINKEFASGKIDVEEYNKKLVAFELEKLNREFKDGKFDIFTYNQRLKELDIQEFNRQLKIGFLTFEQFSESVRNANIEELTAKFEAGKIGLAEYNQELIKISEKFEPGSALFVGANNYITSVGTLSDNIAKAITGTFTRLEDSLLEFTKTGEFNFAKFTSAILEDLQRIIIRMAILKPIAQGITGAFAGGSGGVNEGAAGASDLNAYSNYSTTAAKGAAFYGSVKKFAKGGLVNSPTAFTYNGGKRGLMGEAGTEAIMPLKRTSNGELGVAASASPVVVNIFNQSGAEVTQNENQGPNGERYIDILIHSKVREGLSTGKYDTAMKGSYGLGRKGS